MTATVTDLAVRTLAGVLDLDVERTQYRDHARELAAATTADLVIVHGGDGSINEVVNGVMSLNSAGSGGDETLISPEPSREGGRPLIGVIPGGGANVLARAFGLPLDAAAAIRQIREGGEGGVDGDGGGGGGGAGPGARGRGEGVSFFLRTMVHQYSAGTARRQPALTME